MKNFIYLFSFLIVGAVYGQETNNTNNNQRENRNQRTERSNQRPNYYEIVDTTDYTLDTQRYIFTPDENGGVNVQRVDSDGEIDFGNLRRTTADGYYMMITTPDEETSFGRFDREGNFRSYRYDRENDSIIEENFRIQDPVQRRDQNRRNDLNNRGRNNNRNNNNNNSNNNN